MLKKMILLSAFGATFAFANGVTITQEQAYKQGEQMAIVINMMPGVNTEGKKKQCKKNSKFGAIISAVNKEQMMPHVIKGCQDSIR